MGEKLKITPERVEKLFKKVSKKKYGKEINFTPIIEELKKLKKGGALTYKHLEKIADPDCWPFSKYWRWPSKEQIEEELKKTDGLFKILDGLPEEHEKRKEKERKVIWKLYDIFKHLELTSIVLRFVDPDNYAIYSPPVAKILNSPRGTDYVSEYLNYLEGLRHWRDIYGLKSVELVDMFLWALEEGYENDEIIKVLHQEFSEENIKKIQVEEFREKVLRAKDEEKAEYYYKIGECDTAAKWAGYAFERIIRKKYGQYVDYKESEKEKLKYLIRKLCELLFKDESSLLRVANLRNRAMHPSPPLAPYQVEFMLDVIKDVQRW